MPHYNSEPTFAPSRRAVTRTAAWAVPAMAVATAAPAFAASQVVGLDVDWKLTADQDLAYSKAGDLTFTVKVAALAAGSTLRLVVRDPNSNLEGYIWLEAVNGLRGERIGAHRVEEGGQTTLNFTTTEEVPVGSTFGVTLGPENSSTGSYVVAWTVDPANPVGENLSGTVRWSAENGFASS